MTGEQLAPSDDVIFYEEQRPWLGFVALGYVFSLLAAAFVLYALLRRFIVHRPLVPESLAAEWFFLALAALVMVVAGAVATARLIIEVRSDGLYVQYKPIHFRPKKIDLDRVAKALADTYWPLTEFGGWGICGATGLLRAYTARGNRGVRIIYSRSLNWGDGGRQLLLGSQRPDELAEAIQQLLQGLSPEWTQ